MAIIIYHNADLDGICSAAILHKRFPKARLYGHQYGDEFFVNEAFDDGEMVIMADVSMPMDVMEQIAERSGEFYWIDHHVSAYNDFKAHFTDFRLHKDEGISACDSKLKYVYEQDRAACELCWNFVSDEPMPQTVLLLGMYDTWRGNGTPEWDDIILPFQYGMRLEGFTPETLADFLFDESMNDRMKIIGIADTGKKILKYQAQQDKALMKKSFTAHILGFTAICCVGAYGSIAFESVYDESAHDLMIGLSFDGKEWGFSLRTTKDDVDVSFIAKKFGGGGHKKASGFRHSGDLREILVF